MELDIILEHAIYLELVGKFHFAYNIERWGGLTLKFATSYSLANCMLNLCVCIHCSVVYV